MFSLSPATRDFLAHGEFALLTACAGAPNDWVKAVILIAVPGQVIFLIYQVLRLKAEQRAMLLEGRLNEDRIIKLVHTEMRRLAAEWERARKAKALRLSGDNDRSRLG